MRSLIGSEERDDVDRDVAVRQALTSHGEDDAVEILMAPREVRSRARYCCVVKVGLAFGTATD